MLVSKLLRSRNVRLLHLSNIPYIVVTFDVLKLEKSIYSNPTYSNINDISTTEEVSKPLISKLFNALKCLNKPDESGAQNTLVASLYKYIVSPSNQASTSFSELTSATLTAVTDYGVVGWEVIEGSLDTTIEEEPDYYIANTQYTIKDTSSNEIALKAKAGQEEQVVGTYSTSGQYTFTAPETGTYKLEVWGAQGGGYNGNGGKGGYSKAIIN